MKPSKKIYQLWNLQSPPTDSPVISVMKLCEAIIEYLDEQYEALQKREK